MICLSTSIHVCGTRVNAKGSTLGKQGNQAEKCTQFNRLCANVAEGRRTRLRGGCWIGSLEEKRDGPEFISADHAFNGGAKGILEGSFES
jgi:hypothetical protein